MRPTQLVSDGVMLISVFSPVFSHSRTDWRRIVRCAHCLCSLFSSVARRRGGVVGAGAVAAGAGCGAGARQQRGAGLAGKRGGCCNRRWGGLRGAGGRRGDGRRRLRCARLNSWRRGTPQGGFSRSDRVQGRSKLALEKPEHDRGNKGKRGIRGDYAQPIHESHRNLPDLRRTPRTSSSNISSCRTP
jgi:hypothetical protein